MLTVNGRRDEHVFVHQAFRICTDLDRCKQTDGLKVDPDNVTATWSSTFGLLLRVCVVQDIS